MSKVVTFYADTELTQQLVEEFGTKFQKISRQDKLLMISAIALNAALGEGFNVVMESLDPDHVCDEVVREAIEVILEEKESIQNGLLVALSEQVNAKVYATEGK
ncbi:MAG: hypothetical protein SFY66_19645 [Oculatellaceae cyanobacterium bins.114]|nr:hypothetical protein [Oculatellaceae cyanobacterium bins.114]